MSKKLVECIVEQKPIPLDEEPFQIYSITLQQQVLNIQEGTIYQDFLQKRPQDCDLRKVFHEALLEYKEKHTQKKTNKNESALTILHHCLHETEGSSNAKKQKVDVRFMIKDNIMIIPFREPMLSNIVSYAQKLAEKILKTKTKKILIRQGNVKGDPELYVELNSLRGHVLVEENNVIKLSSRFLGINSTLPGNLAQFKALFFQHLNNDSKFDVTTLNQYIFVITNYKTYSENEADRLIDPLRFQAIPNSLTTGDIDEFLNDIIFSVNQPNADRLDLLIAEQIAKEFNLINTDLISHGFMTGILHWMKEKQGPENRFISEESDIFDEVAKKIAQLIIVGPTCEMVRKISELQLGFQENTVISKRLSQYIAEHVDEVPILLSIFTPKKLTHLGSVVVLQELSKQQHFLKPGSYIFLRLKNWLNLLNEITYALEQHDINLIIIEFKTTDKMPEYDQISYRMNQLLKYKKKFIFIIDTSAQDVYKINANYTSIDFIPEFILFDETTKAALLKTDVIFQGNICALNEIIGNSTSLVDLEIITKLTNKEIIHIGHALWNFSGYDKDWYVSRKFTRQILIDSAILKNSKNMHDMFAIIDKTDEHSEMFEQVVISNFKNRLHAKIIELDGINQFKDLSDEYMKRNIHLLKCYSGALIWIQSHGSITELLPFIVYEKNSDISENLPENLSEEEFSIFDTAESNNLFLVSNEAGMGKSTVLSSISHIIRKIMHRNVWIIRLDLNDYTRVLLEEQASYKLESVDDSISFLVDKLLPFKNDLNLNTTFEKELFKHYLKNAGKMILMIDGVDEISPNYETLIIKLINLLRRSKAYKIFVTTRPHIRKNLEEKLGVFSYKMISFSFENQQEFLRRFLCKKLDMDLLDPVNKYFIDCINDVIRKLHSSISDRERSFMGIPLQMRMIAKIFLTQIDKMDMERSCQLFVDSFHTDLIKLYSEFIKTIIYEVYWTEKKSIDFSKTGTTELMDLNYKIFFKHYQELAVFSLFNEKECYELNFFENFERIQYSSPIGIRNVGLIEYVADKPQFIHRSFAEYFVATYLINKLLLLRDSDNIDMIITQIFCKPQYQVVRAFLNNLLVKEKGTTILVAPIILKKINAIWRSRPKDLCDNLGNTFLHTAAVEGNLSIIEFLDAHWYVMNNDSIYTLVNSKNNRGGTVLHSAVSKGYVDIIYYICSLLKPDNKSMIIDFYAFDNHMKTAFFAAVLREDWNIVKWFIENVPEAKRHIHNPKPASNHFIAHIAVKQGKLDIVQYLLEQGIDLQLVDSNRKTLLHSAISSHRHQIIEWILNNDSLALKMINQTDKDDRTPLMNAVLLGQQSTVELFLKKQHVDINEPVDKNNVTLMHLAAKCSSAEFVDWFIEKMQPDLTKLDTAGHTPLHKTATCGKLDVFKLLFKKYLEVTNSAVTHVVIKALAHIAAISNKLDILQWVIEQCEDKFHKTHILESILHPAAAANQPEQVSWILSQGININSTNELGRTPLHLNVCNGSKGDIEWLIKNGADLNAVDNERRSPLHYAVEFGRIETIQLLINKGANIGIADKNGVTVFHLAAKSGSTAKVKLLCKDPQFLKLQDNNKNTILHYVSRQTRLEQYIWMLQQVDQDINARNIAGITALHNACFKGSIIIVKYLLGESVTYHKQLVKIEKAANANIRCAQNKTILHSVAISGNDLLLKWLIEEKKIAILDSTEILFAARYDRLACVQYLSSKVDMNVVDNDARNILHMACLTKHKVSVLEWLLGTQPELNVNVKDKNGRTPLLVAASFRNWLAVKVLLNHKDVDVNCNDERQWSFLHVVVRCSKFDLLRDLIEKRQANDDVVDKDGRTLLHSAARSGSLDILKYLMNERHLKITNDNANCTLLHAASRSGNVQLCEWLITENMCELDSTDNNNCTALHFACNPGHFDLIKYLVQNHANVSITDNDNVSILHKAAHSGNLQLIEWLVRDKKMSINLVDNEGNTIMHMAVRFGHIHIIDWLLTQGADINMNENVPATAGTVLHQACRYGQWYIARYIIQRGGLVSALDANGRYPIDIANEKKHDAIVDLLNTAIQNTKVLLSSV